MSRTIPQLRKATALVAVIAAAAPALAKEPQFWNVTVDTIVKLQFSPAGKSDWGADQAANGKDHAVASLATLTIPDVPAGSYDVKFTDDKGRTCLVPDITVADGKTFAIEEVNLTGCTH